MTKSDAISRTMPALPPDAIITSAATGAGMDRLKHEIRALLADSIAADAATVTSTAVRSSESLRLAAESLRRAIEIVANKAGDELVAAEIRVALVELGKVAGVVYTDDVLDRIFSRFCIGK